jgi:hypothetical protein
VVRERQQQHATRDLEGLVRLVLHIRVLDEHAPGPVAPLAEVGAVRVDEERHALGHLAEKHEADPANVEVRLGPVVGGAILLRNSPRLQEATDLDVVVVGSEGLHGLAGCTGKEDDQRCADRESQLPEFRHGLPRTQHNDRPHAAVREPSSRNRH